MTGAEEVADVAEAPVVPQIEQRRRWPWLALMVLLVAAGAGAAAVWWSRRQPHLPAAPAARVRPKHPVVIINPLSGDGKAKQYDLADAAAGLGLEVVTFKRGDDLQQLAHDAVDRGADLLMMAGGDGSLAAGAEVAMQRDVRFACIPVGTRNHFAMDLGLDRDDPVQALNAGIDGVEVDVNVGHVGGQVFLNNVSFGIYAEAIADPDYRDHRVESVEEATKDTVEASADQAGLSVQTPEGETMGYATGQFGKNHLGDGNEYLPTLHGFDEFWGYVPPRCYAGPVQQHVPARAHRRGGAAQPRALRGDRQRRPDRGTAVGQGRQAEDRRRGTAVAAPDRRHQVQHGDCRRHHLGEDAQLHR
jgi:hypothetical protein